MISSRRPLAYERPVELRLNGGRLVTLMCTPFDLDELGVGHLLAMGILRDRSELASIYVCPDLGYVDIEMAGVPRADTGSLHAVVASGCGSEGDIFPDLSAISAVRTDFSIALDVLAGFARAMYESASMYRATGGVHCASLVLGDGSRGRQVIREDVGRHNAVDKVLGRAFLDGAAFGGTCILTSGRIAADMALKAAAAGVPVLATRSIPTSAAYEIASKLGITLVGRLGSSEPSVYTWPERIAPGGVIA
ncbi:MAG: formate dehydrogenase accessory sulfurtransferase FdhD [Spirochaetes bacterium]|nr:formate dehydrogenase accessory sulfurtransferase FdhD [Spirochaetota bacterium]